MTFPRNPEGSEIGAVVAGLGRRTVEPEAAREIGHRAGPRMAGGLLPRGAVAEQHQIGEPQRRRQRIRRPGVDLVIEGDASRMVGRQPH